MKKIVGIILLTIVLCIGLCSCDSLFGEHSCIYTEWINTKQATCKSDGQNERYCVICFNAEIQVVSKFDHTPEEYEGKTVTCTDDGRNSGVYC